MLVQFSVANFLSFRDEVVFSMVASSDDAHQNHVFVDDAGRSTRVLRSAAIYGANASGKSNLIRAVEFARKLILNGTPPDTSISVEPFLLDSSSGSASSRFEFVIKYEGVLYTYGFVVDREVVREEWLFAVFNRKEVMLFERKLVRDKSKFEFGNSFGKKQSFDRQVLHFIGHGTRKNQLFLTEAYLRNVEKISSLMGWFRNVLTIIPANSRYTTLEATAASDTSFVDFLGSFLKEAGTGIAGISTERVPANFDDEGGGIPEDVRARVVGAFSEGRTSVVVAHRGRHYAFVADEHGAPASIKLKTRHVTPDGEDVEFEFRDESDGTQRLIHLLPALFTLQSKESVYLIDELDRTLHPLLSRMFVNAFLNLDESCQRGQLVFTTHDTNLLDLDLLRRDEIWFVSKNREGASEIYSLADFNIRRDLVIQKGYLNGRFGAVPFIGDAVRLGLPSGACDPSEEG